MIEIKEKEECCGCTACYSACPKKAITMQADEEGFQYPDVDENKCVNCGLCEKVCPILKTKSVGKGISQKLAIQNRNENERYSSTAGGFFSLVADWVIEEKQGAVFAVGFDGIRIVHKCARSISELDEMRGSKYTQSELKDTFREVKTHLEAGDYCLFVGTPCQVHGMAEFIGGGQY